jgi:superfamily II DNA or RNA helicase
MGIRRFSSRTERLDKEFLSKALEGAVKYYRIAGYFRSSVFELVGEEIARIPEVKIVCNSELDLLDFQVATGRETALKERWNEVDVEAESMLCKERYRRLDELLRAGNVEIRVVPKERLFLHGKAGSIHYKDGTRRSFIGSVNESKSAFRDNYELVWVDDDTESAEWIEEEFRALWKEGVPLPEAICAEVHRVANRREITVEAARSDPQTLPASIMAEAPLYRGGEQLQPWQRSFVTLFMEHRETYGKARLLLADEVGVGKTLSMATSALVCAVLEEKPVLILAPSTLTLQWQIEMKDKLGIPSAVWSSREKVWLGVEGQTLSPKGDPETIARCPYRIAIVSTGLVMHQRNKENGFFEKETACLLKKRYGTIILDEAHKARKRGGLGSKSSTPNNLLAFMLLAAKRTRHMILGTATPIQTDVGELWDLLEVLNTDAEFVLGDKLSPWRDCEVSVPVVTGKASPKTPEAAWEWLRNPLPPAKEHDIIALIRDLLGIPPATHDCSYSYGELNPFVHSWIPECLDGEFFRRCNPVLRHVVLRKRKELEEAGLLERVGVNTHPVPSKRGSYQFRFVDLGILTNTPFEVAYEQAEEFCRLLHKRVPSAGFMKTLMLQRICSSFASGLATTRKMLQHTLLPEGDDMEHDVQPLLSEMTQAEIACLQEIENQLRRPEAVDSKLDTVKWFLGEYLTDGKSWLEHGCIIFSQYYDTVEWLAKNLALWLKDEVVAVYAGAGKSALFRGDESSSVEREAIKNAVKKREIRLVVATDAACEGLNLQTLGTLINVDLPWNPSRLEQRLGRIRRFGQARKVVDMLNLVYHGTQDEKIYSVLSERMKDVYDIFGTLPDTIEDDWIEDEEKMRKRVDAYISERSKAMNSFSVRYKNSIDAEANKWEVCAEVLSRKDIVNLLSEPWR